MVRGKKDFMGDNNKDWLLPEKMLGNQKTIQTRMSAGEISEELGKNDFGAYYALLNDLPVAQRWIEQHNMTDLLAKAYIKNFHNEFKRAQSILDVGCGAGFITKCIKEAYPLVYVVGVDLAEDAIKYANKSFSNVVFIQQAIDCNFNMKDTFDIIHPREFYPFSRTNDYEYICGILTALLRNLNTPGELLIVGSTAPEHLNYSIFGFVDRIRRDSRFNNCKIQQRRIIKTKVVHLLGSNPVAGLISMCLDHLQGSHAGCLLFEKKF